MSEGRKFKVKDKRILRYKNAYSRCKDGVGRGGDTVRVRCRHCETLTGRESDWACKRKEWTQARCKKIKELRINTGVEEEKVHVTKK